MNYGIALSRASKTDLKKHTAVGPLAVSVYLASVKGSQGRHGESERDVGEKRTEVGGSTYRIGRIRLEEG